MYVGQTVNSISQRLGAHVRESRKESPVCRIHSAIRKYSLVAFKVEILAIAACREELNTLEIKFIRELNTVNPQIGYNINIGGAMNEDVRKQIAAKRIGSRQTEETRRKMSIAALDRWSDSELRTQHSFDCGKGKPKSEAHKQKLRKPKVITDNMRKPKTEEHKAKLRGPKTAAHCNAIKEAWKRWREQKAQAVTTSEDLGKEQE